MKKDLDRFWKQDGRSITIRDSHPYIQKDETGRTQSWLGKVTLTSVHLVNVAQSILVKSPHSDFTFSPNGSQLLYVLICLGSLVQIHPQGDDAHKYGHGSLPTVKPSSSERDEKRGSGEKKWHVVKEKRGVEEDQTSFLAAGKISQMTRVESCQPCEEQRVIFQPGNGSVIARRRKRECSRRQGKPVRLKNCVQRSMEWYQACSEPKAMGRNTF